MNTVPYHKLSIRAGTTDDAVYNQIFVGQTLETNTEVRPSLIFDLGAYTGLSTRWFLERYPGAHVIGVEPSPAHVHYAYQNAPGATIERKAIGGEIGMAVLRDIDKGEWAYSTESDGLPIIDVEVVTVDSLAVDYGYPDIVKMDIEGAEKRVFEAGGEWLSFVTLLLVETHDRFVPGCEAAMFKALDETGRSWELLDRPGSSADHAVLLS